MEEILVPLGICLVLPVMIVWLVMRTRQNEMNRKTEIMLKAIESGATIDPEFFKPQRKGQKTIKERLLGRLAWASSLSMIGIAFLITSLVTGNNCDQDDLIIGGILLAIGLALFVVFFVGKKMLAKEMDAEVKSLEKE